jgi:PPOX class probable F420-dependent enzyme
MLDRPRVADGSDQQEADGGYFDSLALARYMRLTTFKRDGTPESASVYGVADGDRAYLRARRRSSIAKRLRHTAAVQVTPCGPLGFSTSGPPLAAIARLLRGAAPTRVPAELDHKRPVRQRILAPLLRGQTNYYELLADDVARAERSLPDEAEASLTATVHTGRVLMPTDAATPTSLTTVCAPVTPSRRRPSGYTRVTTVSMSLVRTPAGHRTSP